MASAYYKPCKELDICNELIEKYWESKQYDKCFEDIWFWKSKAIPLLKVK